MQGIYNYIPETNNVSRLYNFAAVLYLQFLPRVMLFPILNILVISEVRVQCPMWLFSAVT